MWDYNLTTLLPLLVILCPNHNYYRLLMNSGVTVTPLKGSHHQCRAVLHLLLSPDVGWAHVFIHSTSFTLLFSLHVEGLTWRHYSCWNNKGLYVVPHHLNNQYGTNITTSLLIILYPKHDYYMLLTDWCYNMGHDITWTCLHHVHHYTSEPYAWLFPSIPRGHHQLISSSLRGAI
jgi:hypothetical protein